MKALERYKIDSTGRIWRNGSGIYVLYTAALERECELVGMMQCLIAACDGPQTNRRVWIAVKAAEALLAEWEKETKQ